MFKELIPIRIKVHIIIKGVYLWASVHLVAHSASPSQQQMYMISVFWVSFGLAYDSPGGPCLGTERSILIQRNYPLTANSFYSHTPRQWCRYLFSSIPAAKGRHRNPISGRDRRRRRSAMGHYGATKTTALRHTAAVAVPVDSLCSPTGECTTSLF